MEDWGGGVIWPEAAAYHTFWLSSQKTDISKLILEDWGGGVIWPGAAAYHTFWQVSVGVNTIVTEQDAGKKQFPAVSPNDPNIQIQNISLKFLLSRNQIVNQQANPGHISPLTLIFQNREYQG
ncbi:MAG: hypothetical protein LKF37_08385 [Lentilactobacillus diolivorans]|nr:hypothetical protein [Lentilactobacillus diolivorans]RRG00971.1 MAG: hypothetical protein DUD34_13705 [Lactobacillus sp.]